METEFKVGQKVQWLCKPSWCQNFWCTGVIVKMWESTFGACKSKMGARIKVDPSKYQEIFKKETAFVSVDKLKQI